MQSYNLTPASQHVRSAHRDDSRLHGIYLIQKRSTGALWKSKDNEYLVYDSNGGTLGLHDFQISLHGIPLTDQAPKCLTFAMRTFLTAWRKHSKLTARKQANLLEIPMY